RKAVLRIQQAARLDFANKLEALDLAKAAPKLQPELETAPRPKPKPRLGILPLSAKPKLKIVGPPTKIEAAPRVFGKANFAEEKQKALEAIKANRNAEQQEDKSEEPQAPIAPVVWEPAKLATSPVLSRAVPMENARSFVRDKLYLSGVLATYHYQNQ